MGKYLTPAAELSILVDKIHMKGHTDKWCMENCDSRKVEEFNNVCKTKLIIVWVLVLQIDMEVCEQTFPGSP